MYRDLAFPFWPSKLNFNKVFCEEIFTKIFFINQHTFINQDGWLEFNPQKCLVFKCSPLLLTQQKNHTQKATREKRSKHRKVRKWRFPFVFALVQSTTFFKVRILRVLSLRKHSRGKIIYDLHFLASILIRTKIFFFLLLLDKNTQNSNNLFHISHSRFLSWKERNLIFASDFIFSFVVGRSRI